MGSAVIYCLHEEDYDRGIADMNDYLIVNSAGYYEFDERIGVTKRKYGRRDYYLSYNHSGTMTVKTAGESHILPGGSAFVYHPKEEQYYGQADQEPISCYWVHFTGYGVDELFRRIQMPYVVKSGVNVEIRTLFEYLLREVRDKQPGYEWTASSIVQQILALLARSHKLQFAERQQSMPDAIRSKALRYIHLHYSQPISVADLAAHVSLSESRFSNVFREVTGLPPLKYVTQFRLQKAKELMANTSLSIRQITASVGIEDQLYFSKLFKKYMGQTPTAYRQSIASKDAIGFAP